MSQKIINIGLKPGDGSGDPLRVAFNKINQNFSELYTDVGILTGNANIAPVYTAAQIDSMFANIMILITSIDYGFISQTSSVDYGLITDPVTGILDYGSI